MFRSSITLVHNLPAVLIQLQADGAVRLLHNTILAHIYSKIAITLGISVRQFSFEIYYRIYRKNRTLIIGKGRLLCSLYLFRCQG